MSGGQELLGLVQAVRRRLRRQEALAGATLGMATALGLGALALVLTAVARTPGSELSRWGALGGAALVAVAAGAGLRVWRHRTELTLGAAARRMDRAIGGRQGDHGEPDNGDRVRVAVGLVTLETESRLAEAAVAEAARAAATLPPAEVAPWRRPPGLAALVLVAGLLVPIGRWKGPAPRPAAAPPSPSSAAQTEAQRTEARRREMQAAVQEAARLEKLAERLADQELTELARRLAVTLDALQTGEAEANPGVIAGLLADARAAAEEARAAAVRSRPMARAAEASAGMAHDPTSTSAPIGEQEETGRQRRLGGLSDEERRRQSESRVPPPAPEDEKAAGEPERQLRRLGRGLDDETASGESSPPAPSPAERPAGGMAGRQTEASPAGDAPGRPGAGPGAARARLAEAEARLRGALGGGSSGASGPGGKAERSAAGGGAEAKAMAEFERGARGEAPRGEGQSSAAERSAGSSSGSGQGTGDSAGPGPSGNAGAGPTGDPVAQGQPLQAEVAEGPGPSRAESIAHGAQDGFADRGYDRTYRAYRAAVEETLDVAAVPAGRARLVRRYFELIRPRTADPGR